MITSTNDPIVAVEIEDKITDVYLDGSRVYYEKLISKESMAEFEKKETEFVDKAQWVIPPLNEIFPNNNLKEINDNQFKIEDYDIGAL